MVEQRHPPFRQLVLLRSRRRHPRRDERPVPQEPRHQEHHLGHQHRVFALHRDFVRSRRHEGDQPDRPRRRSSSIMFFTNRMTKKIIYEQPTTLQRQQLGEYISGVYILLMAVTVYIKTRVDRRRHRRSRHLLDHPGRLFADLLRARRDRPLPGSQTAQGHLQRHDPRDDDHPRHRAVSRRTPSPPTSSRSGTTSRDPCSSTSG
ncbi:MAG: hypothetical protein MZU97_07045 [Bacillus subtilis]|nr:hypothetical protein [Bacillus subtilis]